MDVQEFTQHFVSASVAEWQRQEEARPGSGDALLREATTSVLSGRDLAQIATGAPGRG